MSRRTRAWATWTFWVVITLSPMMVTILMLVLGFGFNYWIWGSTLVLGLLGFFKAQQSISKLRAISADNDIEHWMSAIRRTRTSRRLKRQVDTEESDELVPTMSTSWQLSRGWTEFRRHTFWRKQKDAALLQQVGNLFHLLGLEVKRVAMSEELGHRLLVNGNTVVAISNNGPRSASDMADHMHNLVQEKASCQVGILVSPSGFKNHTRDAYKDEPLILLDADNLAELSLKYLG